jgi:hypothetical protein
MTHADLVARAARWLRTTMACHVVLTEHTVGQEYPDAIGWRGRGESVVVECKISRSDFLRDRHKASRAHYGQRPGVWCYYLTPPGLVWGPQITLALPEGWGLLHAEPRLIRVVQKAAPTTGVDDRSVTQLRRELYRLYSEVRRYQVQGLKPQTFAAWDQGRRAVAADAPPR